MNCGTFLIGEANGSGGSVWKPNSVSQMGMRCTTKRLDSLVSARSSRGDSGSLRLAYCGPSQPDRFGSFHTDQIETFGSAASAATARTRADAACGIGCGQGSPCWVWKSQVGGGVAPGGSGAGT